MSHFDLKKVVNADLSRDSGFDQVEHKLGREARVALEEHFALFNEKFYLWLADLYDPETGGFYCTVAARDTEGFLPDIQSTAQVLAFLDNSGMTRQYGGWQNVLPDKIVDPIVEFIKGLQSSVDGYIYHPQWKGLKYTQSRLGRDVNWMSEILRPLYRRYAEEYRTAGFTEDETLEKIKKYMPYWDTPAGLKGSLGKPKGKEVNPDDNIEKNNKSTPARSAQLRSLEGLRAYLYGGEAEGVKFPGLNLSGDSYTAGNALSAQISQIRQRDAEAIENGEPYGYVALTKKYLDEGVKSHNGLWEEDIKYNSVNGLMKITAVYNSMGWALPYPDKSMEAAITVARYTTPDIDGKEATASVDVYNPWVAIAGIFSNVEACQSGIDKVAFETKWRSLIKDNAADMIRGTTTKIKKFAKADGSFGYTWGAPGVTAQGMPITVPGVVCGDVDGGCISATGTLGRIYAALDIKEIAPTLFTEKDLCVFINKIEQKINAYECSK